MDCKSVAAIAELILRNVKMTTCPIQAFLSVKKSGQMAIVLCSAITILGRLIIQPALHSVESRVEAIFVLAMAIPQNLRMKK
jgi:hypothetical protein